MNDTYSRAGNAADPPSLSPDYNRRSCAAPSRPLVIIPQTLSEITGPVYGHSDVKPEEADLTKQHAGEPLGERIIVQGRVLDEARPRRCPTRWSRSGSATPPAATSTSVDQHPAPLDPNFTGAGRCRHRRSTATTSSPPSSPAPIPGATITTPGGPAHIHFSLFGPSFLTRLVTQMYFPGDPLFAFDPIFNSVPDAKARERMICRFDLEATQARMGAGLHLRHRAARPGRHATRQRLRSRPCLSARLPRPSGPTCTSA